jgi:endonuclease/exonuclease/phosphatase family metal-dependent hydrolase
MRGLILLLCLAALPAGADPIRVASFNTGLARDGPGLLLRDLGRDSPDIAEAVRVITAADADVLVLQDIDWDLDGLALAALADRLGRAGARYPHRFAARPNTGMASGIDIDGDGSAGTPRDAQGYGRFAGQGGMAVLSRLPIEAAGRRDLGALLWRDLPGNLLGDPGTAIPESALPVQRLSSTAHWALPLVLPDGRRLWLLTAHPTPPVFDGPEDRNGRRNHDEIVLLARLLDGWAPAGMAPLPPDDPVLVAGDLNLDPVDGDGRRAAIRALQAHPRLQDAVPASAEAARRAAAQGGVNAGHRGDPARDTADWRDTGAGNLRVSFLLPDARFVVTDAGQIWPAPESGLLHALIWADIAPDLGGERAVGRGVDETR